MCQMIFVVLSPKKEVFLGTFNFITLVLSLLKISSPLAWQAPLIPLHPFIQLLLLEFKFV